MPVITRLAAAPVPVIVVFSTVTPEVCRRLTAIESGPPTVILSWFSVTLLAAMFTLQAMFRPDRTAPLPVTCTQPPEVSDQPVPEDTWPAPVPTVTSLTDEGTPVFVAFRVGPHADGRRDVVARRRGRGGRGADLFRKRRAGGAAAAAMTHGLADSPGAVRRGAATVIESDLRPSFQPGYPDPVLPARATPPGHKDPPHRPAIYLFQTP